MSRRTRNCKGRKMSFSRRRIKSVILRSRSSRNSKNWRIFQTLKRIWERVTRSWSIWRSRLESLRGNCKHRKYLVRRSWMNFSKNWTLRKIRKTVSSRCLTLNKRLDWICRKKLRKWPIGSIKTMPQSNSCSRWMNKYRRKWSTSRNQSSKSWSRRMKFSKNKSINCKLN